MRLPAIRAALPALALCAALGGCYAYERGPHRPPVDRIPAARVTGPDQACIPLRQFSETRVRDSRTIDFLTSSHRGWRNVLPDDCPGLASERAFSFNTSLSQLCSTDIIRVLEQGGGGLQPGAACGLGRFTPIELAR
ncbi:hypothetical protein ACFOD9_03080 [Novosphingobium bradum]|uniref:Uncharacterized protein n=1 Tax=Novosphingobium bradum TaxID=1737444 RepID=A0ABV7IPR6_9SPHN